MNHPEMIYLGRNRLHRSRANLVQTLNTVAAFERNGIGVKLFLPPWPGGLKLEDKCHELCIDQSLDVVASQLLHPRWKFWPFVRWYRKLLEAVECRYTRSPQISFALANAGLRHHLEIHNLGDLKQTNQLERIIQLHQNNQINQLIPISHSAANILVQAGADADRIHVAPSGVSLEAFASIKPFNPSDLDDIHLISVGRMSDVRGKAIFQHLVKTCNHRVTIVGGSDEDIAAGFNVVPPLPYRKAIAWYDQTTIAAMPYQPTLVQVDTFSPMKLFEAMAAGRPILISDLPVIREIITHEYNGLLIDPVNPTAWASAIERLQNDRELAVRLAANAKQSAIQYSWTSRSLGIAKAIGLDTKTASS